MDQIYRNRKNLAYCKEHGIRVSGPTLGRPRQLGKEEKEQAYSDNIDRIEVERGFSLAKRCYGLFDFDFFKVQSAEKTAKTINC